LLAHQRSGGVPPGRAGDATEGGAAVIKRSWMMRSGIAAASLALALGFLAAPGEAQSRGAWGGATGNGQSWGGGAAWNRGMGAGTAGGTYGPASPGGGRGYSAQPYSGGGQSYPGGQYSGDGQPYSGGAGYQGGGGAGSNWHGRPSPYPNQQSFTYRPFIKAPGGARYFSPYALTPYGSTIVFASPGMTYFAPARPVFTPAPFYPYAYGYAPGGPRWIPGSWSWQWTPQVYTYQAWAPGYFADGGGWVDGRYEARTLDNGFYQKVWVDGYWAEN